MLKNEDLSRLTRGQGLEHVAASDRERDLNILRSGSAPPTVEGSLSSIGGFFNGGILNEEEIRSDPAYVNYCNSNAHINPRLSPPLLSKEDWRSSQRLSGGGGVNSVVGDRRNGGWSGDGEGNGSLFAMQPGFEGGNEGSGNGGGVEWGRDGLIGLSGMGLGGRQRSFAEIIQDNVGSIPISKHSPCPASQNVFDDGIQVSETNFDPNFGASSPHAYASALGTTLLRSSTPDAELVARSPSPHIPPIGGARVNSMDKRDLSGLSSFNGISSSTSESGDLGAALAGLNLSTIGSMDKENTQRSLTKHELDSHHYMFSLQGPSAPTLSGRGGSPSDHCSADSVTFAFTNSGLSGYSMYPSSPPLIENLPHLFENAASALEASVIDSKSFGALGLNVTGAAAGLQNLSRVENQASTDVLKLPLMDPLYLDYLRSNDYATLTTPLAACSDTDYLGNPHLDLLQKAYLGALLSPPKSHYGASFLGKAGGFYHNYFGNSAFGLGIPYSGSPLGGPLLPNSPLGSGCPVMHCDQSLCFSMGIRNPSLLDELKGNKAKSFELSEIVGHVVEFSTDQFGSRFIQQKLEKASTEEIHMVFNEIMPHALSLITDVFGNYVVQKFFEHGSVSQIRELADQLTGRVLTLSLQMYGCRVIQKAIEVVELDQKTKMVKELDGNIMRCVCDQNGNHVIQKCIECVPEDDIQFIISIFYDQVVTLSTHSYGCRVIQRVLEHCHCETTQRFVMDEIMQSICMLAQDQYGNYVVQHVLEHGKPHERSAIIEKLTGQIVKMSQQKFASNVIEKCLTFGTPTERQTLVNEMLGTTDENEPLQIMMKDQFANYVVQKLLETCDDQQLELILNRIKVHLNALKKYTYGKHIVARVEKLVAAGERRISILTFHPAA